MSLALKVARRFVASFFNVGDVILYGKYKNKKGRILSFGADAKGNPTVTLEPVPKGRKQNKTMTLFKIWKMPKPVEPKQAMNITRRVVARYKKLAGLEMGRTVTVGTIRIHRYSDHFVVTDLTNAGMRGKKVRILSITLGGGSTQDRQSWVESTAEALVHLRTYDDVRGLLNRMHEEDPYVNGDIRVERGVDVEPTGAKITLKTNAGLEIEAAPDTFRVLNRQPLTHPKTGEPMNAFQDTNYYSRDKKGAGAFFVWLKVNLSRANTMVIADFQRLWDQLDAKYDFH